MKNWIILLQSGTLQLTNTNKGTLSLFILALADASFFPMPITTFFIVLALINISKAYQYALFNTLGTVAGALTGYAIGHFAWIDSNAELSGLAQFMFDNVPGFSMDFYYKIDSLYAEWGVWIISLSAATPIPYGIISITSGVFNINIFLFGIATLISQGIKFYLLALLTVKSGPAIKKLAEFKWRPLAIITTVCVIKALVILNSF